MFLEPGIKNSTVGFCKKSIHEEIDRKLNNGRNKKKVYIPAKFESYKALACSVSTPVSMPKGILVIKDGETAFKEDVIEIKDDGNGGFNVITIKDYNIKKAFADGCGMISEGLSKQWCMDLGFYVLGEDGKKVATYTPSGFNIRNSWTKGMVFTFPFLEFAKEIAHNYIVEDAWGNLVDIRDVDLIITTNMLKLWDSYNSLDDYLKCCKENGFEYCVCKILPKELEEVRNMNYQFLQSYDFSDEDIDRLIKPTVDTIKGALGGEYGKILLFLKGNKISVNDFLEEEFDFIKALMLDERMKDDPFIKQKVYKMISKKINDSKKGVIQVDGNYTIIAADLYALCEYMFKMEVKGLLKKKEYYSKSWLDKGVDKIVAFRAPMTNHNNIRILNLKEDESIKKWFRFMTTCTILNAWDTTTDAFNGADFDGDALILTNNPILLNNTKDLLPIICEQKSVQKKIITESLLKKANKNGFKNDVGLITNIATTMFDILSSFEKQSEEYKELSNRIICMQAYQQEVIDSIKGCIAKKVPAHWCSYKKLKIKEDDTNEIIQWKSKQLKLVSYKKPYFFIYNYKQLKNDYKRYIKNTNINSAIRFGLTLDELQEKKEKSEEQIEFLKYYNLFMPVYTYKSTMNRICWKLEKIYNNLKNDVKDDKNFDINIIKSEHTYTKEQFGKVKDIYEEYKFKVTKQLVNSYKKR